MMKICSSLLCAWSSFAFAAEPSTAATVPEGLAPSEWADIRAAYEAGRHAPQLQGDGKLAARNPGQQWLAEFDSKGFTVTPDSRAWTWGLDLTGYGDRVLGAAPAQLRHGGGKITCERDENLTEWFVNDTRGLEQGWDLKVRPQRSDPAAPLYLHLSTRGNVRPQVSGTGDSITFQKEDGSGALTYGGLKAWDAEGRKLAVRFERTEGKNFRIAVEDRDARYPVTIDPIAQEALLKASNAGPGDYFGFAVAVSGDTVVVGAPYEDGGINGNPNTNVATNTGAAYVFVQRGGRWHEEAYLKGSDGTVNDNFGSAVAISEDTIVIGAPQADNPVLYVNGYFLHYNAGAAYVFARANGVWTKQAFLKGSNTEGGYYYGDFFGASVAVSGNTVVVGAPDEDGGTTGINGNGSSNTKDGSGAAYVFIRNGANWAQQAYLKASNSEAGDRFGSAVAVSDNTVIVGAPSEDSSANTVNGNQADNNGFMSGAAYVFTRIGIAWSQQAYLKPSNTGASDRFGDVIALSGDTAVIGAPTEDSAASGVNGDQASEGSSDSGAAYVFTRANTAWSQQAYLKASNPGQDDHFGQEVGVSGDTVVIGASSENGSATGVNGPPDEAAPDSGAAYLFTRTGTTWAPQAYLKASNTRSNDCFGRGVGVSGSMVVVGAFYPDIYNGDNNPPIADTGAAYVFNLDHAPRISVRRDGITLPTGATVGYGIVVAGEVAEISFDLLNQGIDNLILTGTPKIAVTGDGAFDVSALPLSPIGEFGRTRFKVRFMPSSGGPKSAVLSMASNSATNDPFLINLSGTGLSYTDDTDGDGLDDASEYKMAALNFNWQVSQTALVQTYQAGLNAPVFYTAPQIQALHPSTPLLAKDPVTGRFKMTARLEKSTDLSVFFDFPAPPGSSVSIGPSGGVDLEFLSPEDAAFFRIKRD